MCAFLRYRASCETTFLISSSRDNGCDIEFTSSSSLITFTRGYNGSCVAGIEEHGFLSNDQRWQHANHDTRKFRNRSMIEKLSEKCNASPAANFYTGGRERGAIEREENCRVKGGSSAPTNLRASGRTLRKCRKYIKRRVLPGRDTFIAYTFSAAKGISRRTTRHIGKRRGYERRDSRWILRAAESNIWLTPRKPEE